MINKLTMFTYGILRKKSVLNMFIKNYNLSMIRVVPDTIKGYVPYHSGGINFVFPVRERQRNKYPDADFIVRGSTVTFYGEEKNLKELEQYIDRMECAYNKLSVTTENDIEAIVYIMDNDNKAWINLYEMGLVIYPDTIFEDYTMYPQDETTQLALTKLFGE